MRAAVWLARTSGLLGAVVLGWAVGAAVGAAATFAVAAAFLGVRFKGKSLYTWVLLYLSRHRSIRLGDVVTVNDEGTGAGVRCGEGTAVVAIRIFGKAHQPTRITGSATPETKDTLDVCELLPELRQSLGITLDSISVVIAGSRRGTYGDYPRIYDTLIGPAPYAGIRETWLLLRLPDLSNGEALQWRMSLGSAAAVCARRTAAMLRHRGVRARVATAKEIVEFERRMGCDGLAVRNRHWDALRSDAGWLTSYTYKVKEIHSELLEQAWLWQVDGVIQNVTLLSDGTATATVTVRSNQKLASAPSTTLRAIPGEQASAAALNMCVARRGLRTAARFPVPQRLVLPVGPSGVLIGKYRSGGRMLLPITDATDDSRVHIAADDSITHRLIARLAGAGEHVTVHTDDVARWKRLRMPFLVVTQGMRPDRGTTVSVVDGIMSPAPRPRTVISTAPPHKPIPTVDVLLEQIGPQTLRVTTAELSAEVDVEMFRVEKPYLPVAEASSS